MKKIKKNKEKKNKNVEDASPPFAKQQIGKIGRGRQKLIEKKNN